MGTKTDEPVDNAAVALASYPYLSREGYVGYIQPRLSSIFASGGFEKKKGLFASAEVSGEKES